MKTMSKIISILGLGLIITLLLTIFIVNPMFNSVLDVHSTINEKKSELDTLDQQITAFRDAQTELKKATRKDDILNAFVTKENLVVSVKDLEAAAAKSQVAEELTIVDPAEKTAGTTSPATVVPGQSATKEIPYSIAATAPDFASAVNFLSYLENLPHFTEISEIDFESGNTSVNSVVVSSGTILQNLNGVFFVKNTTP